MEFLVLSDIHDSWTHLNKMLRLAQEKDGVIFLGDLMAFRKITQESFTNFTKIKDASDWLIGVPGNGPLLKVREYFDELGINLHCKGRTIDDIGFFGVGGVQETITSIAELREFFKNEDTSEIKPDDRAMDALNTFGILHENGKFVVEEWSYRKLSEMEVYASPFEHSENRIYEILSTALKEIKGASIQVMVSHVPPFEPGVIKAFSIGVSTGSKAMSRFIKDTHPTLSISAHYHRHYEFMVSTTKCVVFPAVKNGFYGFLSINHDKNQIETSVHAF
ncbi:MAG: metallophosphoesterase [Candidatus Thorarchaeota archaeon]